MLTGSRINIKTVFPIRIPIIKTRWSSDGRLIFNEDLKNIQKFDLPIPQNHYDEIIFGMNFSNALNCPKRFVEKLVLAQLPRILVWNIINRIENNGHIFYKTNTPKSPLLHNFHSCFMQGWWHQNRYDVTMVSISLNHEEHGKKSSSAKPLLRLEAPTFFGCAIVKVENLCR